ncbi:Bud-site selection protein, BUD22 [Phaffia rhodozyma]|uniref:Bud-site selection protein, BUD22 n=1 Tax=Phaffia rhodozyma TaxID=264483 RepID=A0A0F7SYV4_PHARH|nr:Bud-site selection protein, BUD22 [Phaffia rhodozyma]
MEDDIPPVEVDVEDPSGGSRKRKRPGPLPMDPMAVLTFDQLQKKFYHLNKALLTAAKKAQKLESQKLIKSKNNPKATQEEQTDLSSQLVDVKALSLEPLIALNLHNRLTKLHVIENNPIIEPLVPLPGLPHDNLKSKAANRILSSKAFASEMSSAVIRVKGWLYPEFKQAERAKESAEKRAAAAAAAAEFGGKEGRGGGGNNKETGLSSRSTGGQLASSSALPPPAVRPRSPSLVPEVDHVDYDDSRSEGGEYSGSEDEDSDSDNDGAASRASSSSGTGSGSDSERPKQALTKKAKVEKKPKKPEPAKKKKIASSTFLPSLSAGYTFGGSDSEPEELSDDGGARKNRRGQRARKAIWEKKYGANANHLKAARANGEDTSLESNAFVGRGRGGFAGRGGSSGRGGSTSSTRGGRRDFSVPASTDGGYNTSAGGRGGSFSSAGRGGSSMGGGFSSRAGATGFSSGPPPPSSSSAGASGGGQKKAEGAMHPSWIAKQKMKEREKALGDVRAAVQPKKIVFD